MLKICESDFKLTRHLIPFMVDCAFFAEISKNVCKRLTLDIDTAMISYDKRDDEIVMYINPEFAKKQSNTQIRGLLEHEFNHLICGHLCERVRSPDEFWGIATDLANNSMIISYAKTPKNAAPGENTSALPDGALIPGVRPTLDATRLAKLSPKRQKAIVARADLIESFAPLKASEWYFNKLCADAQQNGDEPEEGEISFFPSMDDHSGWGNEGGAASEALEYIQGKVKSIVEQAVRVADSQSHGWGNIPAEMRAEIRLSVSNIIDWRAVTRRFIGQLVRGYKTSSIKRINKRYPYIHPGTKSGYVAKLIIAIDQSGSVDDEMLEMFFAELSSLTRSVDVTILPFDSDCSNADMFEWKKGTTPKLTRVKCGGTNFGAPTRLVNDPKNRGRWDGLIVLTDGQAAEPPPSRIKRGWVLGKGCKLHFPSDEIQIFLSKEQQLKGAWR